MTREDILNQLRSLRPWLESQGVSRLRLFGSFARDEGREDSDVDLLVDLDRPLGLRFFALERHLAERLTRSVELTTEAALHPIVRRRALAEAILV